MQLRPGVCKNPHPIQYLNANFDKFHIPGSVERICLNLFLCVFLRHCFAKSETSNVVLVHLIGPRDEMRDDVSGR